jgi:hypothetical protein
VVADQERRARPALPIISSRSHAGNLLPITRINWRRMFSSGAEEIVIAGEDAFDRVVQGYACNSHYLTNSLAARLLNI